MNNKLLCKGMHIILFKIHENSKMFLAKFTRPYSLTHVKKRNTFLQDLVHKFRIGNSSYNAYMFVKLLLSISLICK